MLSERAVRKKSNGQLADALKRRPCKLSTDITLTRIRRHEEETVRGPGAGPRREVEQPHDAAVDRRGVLHLEGRGDPRAITFDPEDIDQMDRVRARTFTIRDRQLLETAVAETPGSAGPATIIAGEPDREAEREAEIAQPTLDIGMRPSVRLRIRCVDWDSFADRPVERLPSSCDGRVSIRCRPEGRGGVARAPHVAHQSRNHAEIVRELTAMLRREPKQPIPQRQILRPAAERGLDARQQLRAARDGGIERRRDGGVKEIEKICRGWPQPLDAARVEAMYRADHLCLLVAADARVEELGEGQLVLTVLVDVRYAQLRLPKERMVGALEHLPLLREGPHHGLQRGPPVLAAETVSPDVIHHH